MQSDYTTPADQDDYRRAMYWLCFVGEQIGDTTETIAVALHSLEAHITRLHEDRVYWRDRCRRAEKQQ